MRRLLKVYRLQNFCYGKIKRIPVTKQESKDYIDVAVEHIQSNSFIKAFEYLELSLKFEHPEAFYHLAYLYENGYGVNQDMPKALELYKKSSEQGVVDSNFKLAKIYLEKKDFFESAHYLEICMKHNIQETFHMYVKLIFEKATLIYGMANDQNFKELQEDLSKIGFKGETPRLLSASLMKKTLETSEKCLKLFNDAESKCEIGQIYLADSQFNVLGLKDSFNQAFKYLEEADTDESRGVIGTFYYNKKDYEKAKEYLMKSNNPVAKACLAEMYLLGRAVEIDYSKGRKLLEESMEVENSESVRVMTGMIQSKNPQLSKIKNMLEKLIEKNPNNIMAKYLLTTKIDFNPKVLQYIEEYNYQKAKEIVQSADGEDDFHKKMEYFSSYERYYDWNDRFLSWDPDWVFKTFGDPNRKSSKLIADFFTVCPSIFAKPEKIEQLIKGEKLTEMEEEFKVWREKQMNESPFGINKKYVSEELTFELLRNTALEIEKLQKEGN